MLIAVFVFSSCVGFFVSLLLLLSTWHHILDVRGIRHHNTNGATFGSNHGLCYHLMQPLTFFPLLTLFPHFFLYFHFYTHWMPQCHATFRTINNVMQWAEKLLQQGERGDTTIIVAFSLSLFSFHLLSPFPIFHFMPPSNAMTNAFLLSHFFFTFFTFHFYGHQHHNITPLFRSINHVMQWIKKVPQQGERGDGTVVVAFSVSYFLYFISVSPSSKFHFYATLWCDNWLFSPTLLLFPLLFQFYFSRSFSHVMQWGEKMPQQGKSGKGEMVL